MKRVLIYRDEGCCPNSVQALKKSFQREYDVQFVDRHLLHTTSWQDSTTLLVFPGGRDIPYHDALKGKANTHIKDFVAHGGKYLGICAGGYYGCASIEFEKGNPLEVLGTRELAFFPGVARGPAYGPGVFCYKTESGARTALLDHVSVQEANAYYNGGCAFLDAELYSSVQVISRYKDIEGKPAAIIQCAVGKGTAILSGVHPEYNNSTLFDDLVARFSATS